MNGPNLVDKYSRPEIERRWLVDLQWVGPLDGRPAVEIDDRYLRSTQLRLRRMRDERGVRYKLGKKYGKQTALTELIANLYLTSGEYDSLIGLPADLVSKRRYKVHDGALDIYHAPAHLSGLCIFEIEFEDEYTARRYQPPRFVTREITGDADFTGASLARMDVRRFRELI